MLSLPALFPPPMHTCLAKCSVHFQRGWLQFPSSSSTFAVLHAHASPLKMQQLLPQTLSFSNEMTSEMVNRTRAPLRPKVGVHTHSRRCTPLSPQALNKHSLTQNSMRVSACAFKKCANDFTLSSLPFLLLLSISHPVYHIVWLSDCSLTLNLQLISSNALVIRLIRIIFFSLCSRPP